MTPSYVWSLLFGGGLVSLFVGERIIGAGSSRTVFSVAGALMVLVAFGVRAMRRMKTKDARRLVESYFLELYSLGLVALALYVVQSDLWASVTSSGLDKSSPILATVLGALWPALMAATVLPMILGEMAYASVFEAAEVESLRVKDAMHSGLGLAGALVFAFSIYYVAAERDHKVDLGYFRTAKAGEATQKLVGQLDQPLQVSLFFPPGNEVREQVVEYFNDLTSKSKMLEVHTYDHAVDPQKAKELAVSGNGIVVISRGARKEPLSVGVEMDAARNQLRNFDKEIQKRMLLVAKPQRTVYLTTGHGERSPFPTNDTDKRRTVRDLKDFLGQQGYAVKDLGMAEGLGVDVPTDASIVMIVGPQKPFMPEEVAALDRYFERGGRVFGFLDPENGDMAELLKPFHLTYAPVTLANDQFYGRISNAQSDRGNLATGSYSSHPSVSTLGHLGQRAPMVLLGAGSLSETKDNVPAGSKTVTVDFPVRAHPATWNDLNGNFAFDSPAETRKGWELGAAVVKKTNAQKPNTDGRALFLGDSDAISDGVIQQPGNAYYVLDGTKWLVGDEAITGEVSSEVDVPIMHTKKQDAAWFYLTIFMGPLLVLGVGWLANRRRSQPAKKESK